MKYLYLISFLFINYSLVIAQTKYDTYEKHIRDADSLMNVGDYKNAIYNYLTALEYINDYSGTPYFNAAECALKLNNEKLAEKFIRKGITIGGAKLGYLLNYNGFNKYKEASFFTSVLNDYNSLRQNYFSTIENIDLYLEITKLINRDQFVRKVDLFLQGYSEIDFQKSKDNYEKAKQKNDSISMKKYKAILFLKNRKENEIILNELKERVDSLNIARLMELTKKYGWQDRAFILLWHQRDTFGENNYIWNYFIPLINKEIEIGNESRSFWKPFEWYKKIINSDKLNRKDAIFKKE